MKKHFKVIFTSAGDPVGWKDNIKNAGFTWMHVVPSVKGALRCKKAGVDVIVASGHEGGFHTSWEPVHSMILLPAVVEAVSDDKTLVVAQADFATARHWPRLWFSAQTARKWEPVFWQRRRATFTDLERRCRCSRRPWNAGCPWFCRAGPLAENSAQRRTCQKHIEKSPGVFLGVPDDYTTIDMSLIDFEIESIKAVYEGNKRKR